VTFRVLLIAALAGLARPAAADEPPERFWIGSYGRANAASDLDGGRGRPSQVVAFGPRLTEGSYVELDLGWRALRDPDADVDAVVTFAFGDSLFHETGKFDADVALRNAYVEARHIEGTGAFVWAGSRMYRGDTIYLFDFWPLDEVNTVGAGAGWQGPDWDLALHAGMSRTEDDFQVQRVPVPAPTTFAEDVLFLDRQRTLVSARAEKRFGGKDLEPGFKVRLYGEAHHLPSGRRALPGSFDETEPLPDDRGFLGGVELGTWNLGALRFMNVWLSAATGLAAYGDFQQPFGLNSERRAVDAREYRVALDGDLETGDFALIYAAWARAFFDADGQDEDFDDRVEGAVAVRPTLYLGRWFTPAVEASFQAMRPNGLNPRTLNQDTATVTQLGFIPALTFGERRGAYERPQIRLIYAVSFLNDAALALYPKDDPRARQDVVHFLGVGAEWWFGRGGGY
jgi:maltoporin